MKRDLWQEDPLIYGRLESAEAVRPSQLRMRIAGSAQSFLTIRQRLDVDHAFAWRRTAFAHGLMTATLQPRLLRSSPSHPSTRSAVRKRTALALVFERGSASTLIFVGSTLKQPLTAIEAASECTAEPDNRGIELCYVDALFIRKNLTLTDLW